MTQPLPSFPYHPDPVATGVVVPSRTACRSCGRVRGYVYTGPVYAEDDLRGRLCPWCIADGSAAGRFEALFTDVLDDVPLDRLHAITRRTPGFAGWQQERWLIHCGDGAAFLGRAGAAELRQRPQAWEAVRAELGRGGWSAEQVEQHLGALSKDGQPTAYLFRCRVCDRWLAYTDAA
ncbi:CbrC family protein [Streptomyces sp. NPDC059740]|uniref:CbrC family protein n=1 Tax=Streptomyces sp. NPDC059740 TaxID=3346926 RepID=UPI0036541B1E